jgi:hypothetical protein
MSTGDPTALRTSPPPTASGKTESPPSDPGRTVPPLPSLNESDAAVLDHLGKCLPAGDLLKRITGGDLVRRFVAAVDNIGAGESPVKNLTFLVSDEPFKVSEKDAILTIDPVTHDRYKEWIDMFLAVNNRELARIYPILSPLFEEAYAELGYPGKKFEDRLWEAVVTVLSVPVPTPPIRVIRKLLSYEFAEPQLESLSPAAKDLLRLGPDNIHKIQIKIKALVKELDIWDKEI